MSDSMQELAARVVDRLGRASARGQGRIPQAYFTARRRDIERAVIAQVQELAVYDAALRAAWFVVDAEGKACCDAGDDEGWYACNRALKRIDGLRGK